MAEAELTSKANKQELNLEGFIVGRRSEISAWKKSWKYIYIHIKRRTNIQLNEKREINVMLSISIKRSPH